VSGWGGGGACKGTGGQIEARETRPEETKSQEQHANKHLREWKGANLPWHRAGANAQKFQGSNVDLPLLSMALCFGVAVLLLFFTFTFSLTLTRPLFSYRPC